MKAYRRDFGFITACLTAMMLFLTLNSCAVHAQVQRDDIAFARNPDGRILALSSQPCAIAGFYYWHVEEKNGTTSHTGCWTPATHRRIMLMDHGEAVYFPLSRFSTNPHFELGTPHANDDDATCRGGSGDDPKTWEACRRRDAR